MECEGIYEGKRGKLREKITESKKSFSGAFTLTSARCAKLKEIFVFDDAMKNFFNQSFILKFFRIFKKI